MRILLWAEFQKLRRSNIILFTIFAAILIAVIVFICGLTTFSDDQLTANTVGWYMTITQVLATIFVLPSVIALLGSLYDLPRRTGRYNKVFAAYSHK